jgi:hypothetical protein
MPKLNSRGDAICGVAGIQGSLNQRPYPFATYGRGCWYDDDTILVAFADAGGAVYGWRPFADPNGTALWVIDPRAFNFIAGGGGKWVALIATNPPVQFGSLGDQVGAGAADVALDGTIVYKTDYFGSAGLTIVHRDGTRVDRPDGYPLSYVAIQNDRAIWPGGAYGRAPVRPFFADASGVKLATVNGEDWLVYWSESAGVVVQPDGSSDGYTIRTQTMFDYDVVAIGDDVVVASSLTAGEGPYDLTVFHANRASLRYVVGAGPAATWGPLTAITPPDPPDPPDPEPPDPPDPHPPDPPDPVPPDPVPPDPDPPDPVPPQPPTPEVPPMLYVDLGTSKVPPIAAETCETIAASPDLAKWGTIALKSVQRARNGEPPMLSITDAGAVEWRPEDKVGAFEVFHYTAAGLVADRDWNDRQRSYLLPCAEVK